MRHFLHVRNESVERQHEPLFEAFFEFDYLDATAIKKKPAAFALFSDAILCILIFLPPYAGERCASTADCVYSFGLDFPR